MRALRLIVLALGCLGFAAASHAGLTPTKGSQLVTLTAGGECPITGHPNATLFSLRLGPDGASAPFTIPAKQILVLTEVTASGVGNIAGDVFFVSVLVGNGDRGDFAAARFTTVNASGMFDTSFTPPNGIVVKSGNVACLDLVDTNHVSSFVGGLGVAHGFLAPDK